MGYFEERTAITKNFRKVYKEIVNSAEPEIKRRMADNVPVGTRLYDYKEQEDGQFILLPYDDDSDLEKCHTITGVGVMFALEKVKTCEFIKAINLTKTGFNISVSITGMLPTDMKAFGGLDGNVDDWSLCYITCRDDSVAKPERDLKRLESHLNVILEITRLLMLTLSEYI